LLLCFTASAGDAAGTVDRIRAAVAAIRRSKVVVRPDGHLQLPKGIPWPIATNNVLFVRKYYAPLYESVLNRCQRVPGKHPHNSRRIVTGQPGIGKSVFG
jgi:hypothetical protein